MLVPQADIARPALVQGLTAAGLNVTALAAYRTTMGSGGVALRELLVEGAGGGEGVDAITFTSPSTVRNLLARLEQEGGDALDLGTLQHVVLACIGPVTADAMHAAGRCRRDRGGDKAKLGRAGRSPERLLSGINMNATICKRHTSTPVQYPAQGAAFPAMRPRRMRISSTLRRMVRETSLSPADFIYPLFVRHGRGQRVPIESMPGQSQFSVDQLAGRGQAQLRGAGHPGRDPLRHPRTPRTRCGSDNYNPDGIVPQAIRAIKDAAPETGRHLRHVLLRVHRPRPLRHHQPAGRRALSRRTCPRATCSTTRRCELLARASVVHAEAGADIIAPSGMIDGMVRRDPARRWTATASSTWRS